ncbi:MAG: PQQ-binding-like beta-propeller repeat protein [Planctomycetota bacterium]
MNLNHRTILPVAALLVISHFNQTAMCQEQISEQASALQEAKAGQLQDVQKTEKRFREAAREGNTKVIKQLIDAGVEVNSCNKYGLTAIYYAADRGHTRIVDLLIAAGANVEIKDEPFYRLSPMIMAARKGHDDVVASLLDAGASCGSWTASWPASLGFTDVVKVLVEKRPDVFPKEQLGGLLKTAQATKNIELARYLESKGAVLSKEDSENAGAADRSTFKRLSDNELKKLDGEYRGVNSDESARVWVRNSSIYFGEDFELAAELNQIDHHTFEVSGTPGVKLSFSSDLGSGFEVLGSVSAESQGKSFVRLDAQPQNLSKRDTAISGRWPRFRGPDGAGLADGMKIPSEFDIPNGKGLRWKTAIPGVGHSSPVVWGNRVFLTTAVPLRDEDPTYVLSTRSGFDTHQEDIRYRWSAICVDLSSGKILWSRDLSEGVPVARRHVMSSHANCTPALDANHVVVNLAGQGIYCLTHDGELIWKKDLGRLASGWFMDEGYEWGFASSPVIHEESVFLQCDVFGDSFLAALSLTDGKEIWRTPRSERSSWGTPLVLKDKSGTQIVTNGTEAICSYDATSGKELWRINGNSEVTVASPIPYGDHVFVMGGYMPIQPIFSIDANARGILNDHPESIPWQTEKGGAYCITPIVYEDLLFVLQSNGVITCRDARDGQVVYKGRVAGGRSGDLVASPIAADGNLLIPSSGGDIFVLPTGREYTRPRVCPVGESIMASPAAANGVLLIRGLKNLYCIDGS